MPTNSSVRSSGTETENRHFRLVASGAVLDLMSTVGAVEQPGRGQVLIRVGAASLNYRDLIIRQDASSNRDGLVPLSDGAGTIVALGAEVARWQLGDRVSINFFPTWKTGPFSPSILAKALGGGETNGMLSQYVIADADSLVRVPDHLSLPEASTLPCAALTAWHALFERGKLEPNQTVLVQGTGGVAVFALQFAVALGARVIVTSSSDDKLTRARTLGAWQTINYRSRPNWDEEVIAMTDGRGVDHVLELGGPGTYNRSISAVAPGGSIAQIGVLTGFASQPQILPLQFKNANIHGICVGSVEQFVRMNQFIGDHRIRPVIDSTFAFDDAVSAYEHVRSAGHFGKVVISTQ